MPLRKKIIFGCIALTLCIGAVVYYIHKTWPYGMRDCCLPCTMSALRIYASDHSGWYPRDGKTPLESLQTLYSKTNDYITSIDKLAGISGDRQETQRRVQAGLPIDETVSSWIYFPGFCNDDGEVAIIWERQEGIRFNGHIGDGHAVGYADGFHAQIPQARWGEFVKQQEALRHAILAKREN